MKTKNKLIIAFSALGVVAVAAIVALVAVLAAQTQNVSSTISVTYEASDVTATVSAKYKLAAEADWQTAPGSGWTEMSDGEADADNDLVFEPQHSETTGTLSIPAGVNFNSTNDTLNFVYTIQNRGANTIEVFLKTLSYPVNGQGAEANTTAYFTVETKGKDNSAAQASAPAAAENTAMFEVAGNSTATVELVFTLTNLAKNLPDPSSITIAWKLADKTT